MKIEIGESLIYSWLRHVQGCAVTQMSWKPSPTWTVAKEPELEEVFGAIRSFASGTIGAQIFKKGDFSQFIRQAEIDVLGIRLSGDGDAPFVIAVDSAFHQNGLQYGPSDETVGRVLKKLIRGAFAVEAYLKVAEATVIFATPKMSETVRERIERHLALLEQCLVEQRRASMPRLHFRIIANADFTDEILKTVMDKLDSVADTSELFMRAQQLARLCDATPRRRHSAGATTNNRANAPADQKICVPKHVRETMKQLAKSGRLTARIVGDLHDARYCRARFNLGHPFLRPVDTTAPLRSQRVDRNGYGRYWKQPLQIGDHEFLMCSQWYAPQLGLFDCWVREIG